MHKIQSILSLLLQDIWRIYFSLLKVLIPATIIVKILDMLGATQWLATILSPVMSFVGLSESLGLVWAVALLTNIYTAMAVFYSVAANQAISVADISVLGTMILICHAIPVEGAVAKATGVSWRVTITVRIGGALLLGAILNQIYTLGNWHQEAITLLWQPTAQVDTSLSAWAIDQLHLLLSIFCVLSGLVCLLKIFRRLGIEALMHRALYPLLRSLTLGKEAANITVIGATLGLSLGAGLLIDEVKQGHISKRDTLLVMSFLGLFHSMIEDTLLILLLGPDFAAIVWARLIFAIIVIAIWARLMPKFSEQSAIKEP